MEKLNVYIAGKINIGRLPEDGDREPPLKDGRPFHIVECPKAASDREPQDEKTRDVLAADGSYLYTYVGPWGVGENHAGGDMTAHSRVWGCPDRHGVMVNSFEQIRKADVVIAILNDDLDCHGTLVEIGYASSLALNGRLERAIVPVIVVPLEGKIYDGSALKTMRKAWFALQTSAETLRYAEEETTFRGSDTISKIEMLFERGNIPALKQFASYRMYRDWQKFVLAEDTSTLETDTL